MAFVFVNPNPKDNLTGDCIIRALVVAMDSDWDTIFLDLCIKGFHMKEMPSMNKVWMEYLKDKGWRRHIVPDTCPDCYTVRDFCGEHFKGTYILGTGTHVVAVKDGDYYDSWDSGDEYPVFYWEANEDDES